MGVLLILVFVGVLVFLIGNNFSEIQLEQRQDKIEIYRVTLLQAMKNLALSSFPMVLLILKIMSSNITTT